MILVRDVFRLKFGKARDALAAFKEVGDAANRAGFRSDSFRVLTDLVGPYYARTRDDVSESLGIREGEHDRHGQRGLATRLQQFTPHVESGYREVFTIVQ